MTKSRENKEPVVGAPQGILQILTKEAESQRPLSYLKQCPSLQGFAEDGHVALSWEGILNYWGSGAKV